MPIYDFINTNTGEIIETMMTIEESEEYLKQNPEIKKYHGKGLRMIDEIALGRKKLDTRFGNILERIKKNNPGHSMNNSRFNTTKEI